MNDMVFIYLLKTFNVGVNLSRLSPQLLFRAEYSQFKSFVTSNVISSSLIHVKGKNVFGIFYFDRDLFTSKVIYSLHR